MSHIAVSTSLQRTYRYLRIGIAGAVVVIFVSVAVAAASAGWLTSVSDYFYTPARNAFVGALVAASMALIALSGRGLERALLDAAALFAPLVALVPTTLAPGAVPGVAVPCAGPCFPPAFEPDAANGVVTYLVVGGITVALALVLVVRRQASLAAIGLSLAIAVAVLLTVALTWTLARDAFLQLAHLVATVVFFALFAAVAVRNALPRRRAATGAVYRVLYGVIAAGLVIVLVAYAVLLPRSGDLGFPLVLVVEASALVLFAAFWIVQGVEKWDDPDPTIL